MQTELSNTHTPALFAAAVQRAATLLRAGEVVALPTETVYGLAANAWNASAVERIYAVKGRPAHNPIIVHVASQELAHRCVTAWPDVATRLAQAFWPGPLTLVLPRAAELPAVVTAGGPTVGVRWPSHPFMQAVIRECGFPLAAPSANQANCLSPTSAGHVLAQLGGRIPLVVDGGQAQVGIESTVVDLTSEPPAVLRPGMIHEPSLIAVTGELVGAEKKLLGGALKSPGQLQKHYAPQARLLVLGWRDEADLHHQLASRLPANSAGVHVIAHTHIPAGGGLAGVSVIPHDAEAFARAIYAELHRCDAAGARTIVVEAVPAGPEWRALADRLNRAAAG
jgi:L-threonylcarbamoyladenylate synthase